MLSLCTGGVLGGQVRATTRVTFVLLAVLSGHTYATDVTLRWDHEPAGAAGFAVYCGTKSQWYTTRLDVGNTDEATLAVPAGTVHFCAVAAYDNAGVESYLSNEVAVGVTDGATPAVSVAPPLALEPGEESLVLTPTGFRVRFNRTFDSNALDLLWREVWLETPDVALVGARTGIVPGSIVIDPDRRGFTFVKTAGVLVPDTYTLIMRSSSSDALRDEFGRPLDGNGDGIFGDDFVLDFAVPPSSEPILSIGEFARGPGQPVRLPPANAANGIPVRLMNATGVTAVEFTLRYSPRDLRLLGVRPGANGGGTAFAVIDGETGVARIRLEGLSGLAGDTAEVLILDAEVPMTAAYGSAHVLDISEQQINGGAIAGRDDDGLHVVAYFGDTTGNSRYSSLDLFHLQQLAIRNDRALSAYPRIDPLLIADITGNGVISSLDTARLSDWIRNGLDPAVRPEFEAMPSVP